MQGEILTKRSSGGPGRLRARSSRQDGGRLELTGQHADQSLARTGRQFDGQVGVVDMGKVVAEDVGLVGPQILRSLVRAWYVRKQSLRAGAGRARCPW
jgi:hypothetical protein